MSWFESVTPKTPTSDSAKPLFESATMTQLGALSPLWMVFLGASTAGMAYWGMTYWMRLATPEKIVENVVKLRLVKSVPPPAPVEAAAPLAPGPAMVEPVVAEVASVSIVAPEPVAEAVATMAPKVVKVAPKAEAPGPEPLTTVEPPLVVPEPVVAPPKAPAKRGRPPKAASTALAPEPAKAAAVKDEPKTVAPTKTGGAKRGPKPKIKA